MNLISLEELDKGTVLDSALGVGEAAGHGDWVGAGLHTLATGIDAASLVANPVGALGRGGMEWLLEHCRPLTGILDELTGVPADVQRCASTLIDVAAQVRRGSGAPAPTGAGRSGAGWRGEAREAHDRARRELEAHGEGIAESLEWVAGAVRTMGATLEAVRGFVRGLLADVILTVTQHCVLTGATLGLASPALVLLAGSKVAAAVGRASAKVAELASAVARLETLLGRITAHLLELARRVPRRTPAPAPRHRGESFSEQHLARLRGVGAQWEERLQAAARPASEHLGDAVGDATSAVAAARDQER